MEQRLADRMAGVKALVEQLAQARVQFEQFQEAIAAQRLEDRQAFDRHAGGWSTTWSAPSSSWASYAPSMRPALTARAAR